MASEKLNQSGF